MIQKGTCLNVVDNSGAKIVRCIQVVKGYRNRYANIGDIIIVSIQSLRIKRRVTTKVKKGDVCKALIIRTKSSLKNYDLEELKFFNNDVVLLSRQDKLFATRVFGLVPKIFRFSKYLRIVSLSSGFIK
jgi:large subunit ribosomal protein L14